MTKFGKTRHNSKTYASPNWTGYGLWGVSVVYPHVKSVANVLLDLLESHKYANFLWNPLGTSRNMVTGSSSVTRY